MRSKRGWMLSRARGRDWLPPLLSSLLSAARAHWIARNVAKEVVRRQPATVMLQLTSQADVSVAQTVLRLLHSPDRARNGRGPWVWSELSPRCELLARPASDRTRS